MDGRCKDCTLDKRLEKLQVLRFVKTTRKDTCETQKEEGTCSLYEEKTLEIGRV